MPRPRHLLALAGLLLAGLAAALASAPRDAGSQVFTPRAVVPMLARDEGAPPPPPATPTPFAPTAPPTAAQPTPTPRPPTATPTPAPSGLRLQGASGYVSGTGSIHVLGIVVNNLSTPVEFVEIGANFYSASGQLLSTDWGFASVRVIPPGGSSPFRVLHLNPPAGVASYVVYVRDYDIARRPPVTDLQVTVTNIYRSISGTVHVVGTVRNNGSVTRQWVDVIGAFVAPSGEVIRVDTDYSDPRDLAPGQQGVFDILFFGAPAGMESQNFLVWVDADS